MRLFQADYYSVSVRATANFLSLPSEAAGANIPGSREIIESLTLEQSVLAVFRPRPHLPSPVPDYRRGSDSGARSPAEGPPTSVHDWSIVSLLLPPKLAAEWASATGKMLDACPVATRSAIHVLSPAEKAEFKFDDGGETSSVAGGMSDLKEACEASKGVEDQVCGDGTRVAFAGCSDASGSDPGLVITSRSLLSSTDRRGGEGDALPEGTVSDFLQAKLYGPEGMGSNGQVFDLEVDHAASTPMNPNATDFVTSGAATISSPQGFALLDHFLAGRGGTRGVSVGHLVNLHATAAANVNFLQAVPYFMVPLLGTLRARLIPNHKKGSPIGLTPEATANADGEPLNSSSVGEASPFHMLNLGENVTLTPGEGKRSTVLELRLWVPPGTTLVFGFDFFKRFLTVEDFPPDPSRGFDVPPPMARFEFVEGGLQKQEVCEVGRLVTAPFGEDRKDTPHLEGGCVNPSCRGSVLGARSMVGRRVVYAYGEAGLMDTPQPDFSMPFNVITFTSTIITFFLGTAINLLVRKRVNRQKKGNPQEARLGLVGRAWQKWRMRKRGAEPESLDA